MVTIKDTVFGDGFPRIFVPITGRDDNEILASAAAIVAEAERLEAQFNSPLLRLAGIEFRADYYDGITNSTCLLDLLGRLRETAYGRLILFTYRSEEEGGELRHDRAENMIDDIYDWVMPSGYVDMIDVELFYGNYRVARLTTKAHDCGLGVIISNHNFDMTPRDDKIVQMLRSMEILGGDILKCAYSPKNSFDTRRIIELNAKVTQGRLVTAEITKPTVLISMGETGKLSRIAGPESGAALTFASVGQTSAPGQMPLEELFTALAKHI